MASCTACHRWIEWYPTAVGGRMPVDPMPAPTGNVVIENGVARVLTKTEITKLDEPELFADPIERHTSHFATCPDAASFRRCRKCRKSPCLCADRDRTASA